MALQLQEARGSLPARGTQVRAEGIDVRTGGREMAQAVAGLGWSIADLGEKYYNTQANTQLSRAERIAVEEMNRLSLSFDGNLDPETYQKEYQKSLETIQKSTGMILTNKMAAHSFGLFLNDRQPRWEKDVKKAQRARVTDNWTAELFERQASIEQSGIYGDFSKYVVKGVSEGMIDRSDGVRLIIKAKHDVEFSQAQRMALNKPETTLSNIKGDKLKGFDKLLPDDILRIRNIANSTITQTKIAQKQQDDEIGDGFLQLLINKLDPSKPQLTFDAIVSAEGLSFDAKSMWLTKLQVFDNYSEAELREAFTDKGHVLADIYYKIDNGTLTDELDTMVGKGLSPTTAQRLKKEIREPYKAKTEQLFKRIFGWSPELGFENDLSSFLYEKVLREWEAEIKKQDATGEQIKEIGRSIARPYFIEHLEKTMAGQEADIPRMVELALGEKPEKTEPEVKPKEDEGPRTYQDFEDEVTRLKIIDMGKARAYYDAWINKFTEEQE